MPAGRGQLHCALHGERVQSALQQRGLIDFPGDARRGAVFVIDDERAPVGQFVDAIDAAPHHPAESSNANSNGHSVMTPGYFGQFQLVSGKQLRSSSICRCRYSVRYPRKTAFFWQYSEKTRSKSGSIAWGLRCNSESV